MGLQLTKHLAKMSQFSIELNGSFKKATLFNGIGIKIKRLQMRFSNKLTYLLLPFLKDEKWIDQHCNKVDSGKDGEME